MHLFDRIKDRHKYICVIVGALLLHDAYKTLETHATVDVLGGQTSQRAVRVTAKERMASK